MTLQNALVGVNTTDHCTPLIIVTDGALAVLRTWSRTWRRANTSVQRPRRDWRLPAACCPAQSWQSWSSRTRTWRRSGTCWWDRWTRHSTYIALLFWHPGCQGSGGGKGGGDGGGFSLVCGLVAKMVPRDQHTQTDILLDVNADRHTCMHIHAPTTTTTTTVLHHTTGPYITVYI